MMFSSLKSVFLTGTIVAGLSPLNAVIADNSSDVEKILRRLNQLENEITSLKEQLKEKTETVNNKKNSNNKNNFYVSSGLGLLGDSFFTDACNGNCESTFSDTPINGSWSGELGVGYYFTDNFRGEISYSTSVLRDNTTYSGGGHMGLDWVDNHSIFISSYFDFSNKSKFTPYLGIGIGPSLIDTDQVFAHANKNTDITFGYQGKFGISYDVFDTSDLFLEGVYQATKSFKLHNQQIDPLEMFSTRLGIRYKF